MLAQIVAGAVTGLGYTLIGWRKNIEEKEFDYVCLAKNMAVNLIVGAAAGYWGQDFNVLLTGSVGVTVNKFVDIAWSFIKKKLK